LRLSGFLKEPADPADPKPVSSASILYWSLRRKSFGGDAFVGSKKLYTHSLFLVGLLIGIGIAILLCDVGILISIYKKIWLARG
jgi:hypothetical protein